MSSTQRERHGLRVWFTDAADFAARILGSWRFWAVAFAAHALLTLLGPFGTFAIPVAQRGFYWTVTGLACATTSVLVIAAVAAFWRNSRGPGPLLVGAAISALPNTVTVQVLIELILPDAPYTPFWVQFTRVLPIGFAIAVVMYLAFRDPEPAAPTQATNPLIERIPIHKRGPVRWITVRDHYVDVTTARGTELVLMPMRDAASAMGDTGMQIHRSHWVAFDAVRSTARTSSAWRVTLHDGTELPIGRSYVKLARERGLIR